MGRKKKGKAAKKAHLGQASSASEEQYKRCPHSFVFHRGHVGKNIGDLIPDMRRVMEPFTASHLKVRRKNVLKDFVSVAGMLNVTHFITFSKTEVTTNMKVMRLPRGPTLTFQLQQYSLARDVISSLKRYNMEPKQFNHHPLLVMNGFSGEGLHFKLMSTMFQNMFPAVNVNKVKLSDIRRCVLLNYNHEDKSIEFRHYNIRVVPVGMSRGVKKLVRAKVPDMGRYDDISEYLLRPGELSESEGELEGPANEVTLPQSLSSRGNIKAAKSAVRLTEIGPRLRLQLVKIEDGLCEGEVLYHEFIEKTPEELAIQRKMREAKRKLKEQRRQRQEADMSRKQKERDDHKEKSLAGIKRKQKQDGGSESDVEEPADDAGSNADTDEDIQDDIDYYRQEVGDEPDPELFPSSGKKPLKRKWQEKGPQNSKKAKMGEKADSVKKTGSYKKGAFGKQPVGKNKTDAKDTKRQKKPMTDLDRIKRRKVRQEKKKVIASKFRRKGNKAAFNRKR